MKNPDIKGKEYQQGPLYKIKNMREYIEKRQDGKCFLCGKNIEHVHHIVPRSEGGSDGPENLVGLCESCHQLVHTDPKTADVLESELEGASKSCTVSLLNSVMHSLTEKLATYCDKNNMVLYLTTGRETYDRRKLLNLPKDHCIDAYVIALSAFPIFQNITQHTIPEGFPIFHWERYKRKSANVLQEVGSRKYSFNGKQVAVNRHKATAQTKDSLEEYREKYIKKHGEDAWNKHVGGLKVEPAKRTYTARKLKSRDNPYPCGMLDSRGKTVFWHAGDTVLYEKGKGKKRDLCCGQCSI